MTEGNLNINVRTGTYDMLVQYRNKNGLKSFDAAIRKMLEIVGAGVRP